MLWWIVQTYGNVPAVLNVWVTDWPDGSDISNDSGLSVLVTVCSVPELLLQVTGLPTATIMHEGLNAKSATATAWVAVAVAAVQDGVLLLLLPPQALASTKNSTPRILMDFRASPPQFHDSKHPHPARQLAMPISGALGRCVRVAARDCPSGGAIRRSGEPWQEVGNTRGSRE